MGDYGLSVGTPEIGSVGAITFGPGDVLFVADNATATVFARVARDIVPAFAKEPGYPITLVGEPFLERP